jgi:hypothetical protein
MCPVCHHYITEEDYQSHKDYSYPCPHCGKRTLDKFGVKYLYSENDEQSTERLNPLTEIASLIEFLDIVETSSFGRDFHPNHISSCRCLDARDMDNIFTNLNEMLNSKEWIAVKKWEFESLQHQIEFLKRVVDMKDKTIKNIYRFLDRIPDANKLNFTVSLDLLQSEDYRESVIASVVEGLMNWSKQ